MANVISMNLEDAAVRGRIANAIDLLRRGGTAEGPMRNAFRRAAARYLGFIRTRYVRASRGDGTWKELARATKLAKLRKIAPARLRSLVVATGKKTRAEQLAALLAGRPFPILRDKNNLFGSLSEGAPGSVVNYRADAVEVGTAVRYARFHQNPTKPGRPPQRLILVPPDGPTEAAIVQELARGILETFGSAGGGRAA